MSLCGKTIYATRTLANTAIKGSHKASKIKGKRNVGLNQVYFCDSCNAWHTSSGGRRGRARTANFPISKEFNTVEESHKKPENLILHIKDFTGHANRNNP